MAIRLIPSQLVKLFDREDSNQRNKRLTLDYRTYCQIVREEQTTMFQLQLLPDSENLITNGDFQSDISGWTITNPTWQWASGRLQGEKTGAGDADISQTVTVTPNKTYHLTFNAQFGQQSGRLLVFVIGTTYAETLIFDVSEYGTDSFTGEIFFNTADTEVTISFILVQDERDLIYIDDVTLFSLTEPTVTLETCNGDLVETIPVFARSNDYLSYAVDWFGKDEGCYRICIEGADDTEKNYLDRALALSTEGGAPIELEQGGYLKWFG